MSQGSWIGQTLSGRYKIEERLGQGGMSAVYKATDANLRRVVAIKMIHSHLSGNPDFVRRFEEEAAAVAQLRHPNIIQVYDFNHDGDEYYMVLEFVPGETLQERLRRLNEKQRRMPPGEAANFISQVGDAIQYAHERGMIHRDIKPANIMLDIYGKAILMDFGIAKILGGQLHTATGAVVGTAMYMSPEQIVGERVDERSDIYSLGVTLFETLSGKPPFEADSAMTLMMMHMNDPVPNIRELRPELPDDLVQVAERALEKKKELRFQSAAQMSASLKRISSRLSGTASAQAAVNSTLVEESPAADATVVDRSASRQPPPVIEQQRSVKAEPVNKPLAGRVQADVRATTPPAYAQPAQNERVTPAPVNSQPVQKQSARALSVPLLIGGGVGLLAIAAVVLVGLFFVVRNFLPGSAAQVTRTPTLDLSTNVTATANAAAALAAAQKPTATDQPTPMPTATSVPTTAPTATAVLPTQTPAPIYTPTPAVPTDRLYVLIKNITIQNNQYVVDYETYGYTEKLPGVHVHFFFDTVKPENAGMPGSGPWILYGGPRPFTKYAVADRPVYANQMCALVANANHSVQPDSGNCLDLPNP